MLSATPDSPTDPPAQQLADVAVIGTGAMGTGIAQVAAQAGHRVHLLDAFEGAADKAHQRLGATLTKLASKGKISQADADAATARLDVVDRIEDLPACGLVIEAIREDLGDKRALFTALAERQPADTLLATNTSSLDIAAIAEGLPQPERVLGLHFFNPPPLMKLVEVIHGHNHEGPDGHVTAESTQVLNRAAELVRRWGKTPVSCTSTPGFIVNRVARPFYGEAQRMVADGTVDPATVDLTLRRAGFRMGPMELTDLIGQDVNLAVGTSVWEQTGRDERYTPTDYQRGLVEAGKLGRKTGQGVFSYDDTGRALDAEPDEELAAKLTADDAPVRTNPVARTIAMLVNEAVDLVARGEASAEDVDTAMKLGTNYPKGPLEWGREIGFGRVAEQLRELDEAFPGGRYRLSPGLLEGDNGTAP
ncbi:MAG TPA: 3-hydroxyacyl-CoA dehydrogenase NAD-binding domain-containing protein [Segeticoccus sp.]|uniref:3-hydroxyacyl-CoA dehydrogenase NAD-binding domain-containing protein n=1 Tax=Segeticoccus sp. TaxID=2706531 RepID=UPI002D804503|nr:3-hydroxyacyl-CoA dehydrogenase NAD-binding domain-containing protein [Segeticoccus sp.]HET8602023.1 3-hydroxyacyl-CoA dehydrogenase NAD-binding domain-containing protein [Segeticoccus sp.]